MRIQVHEFDIQSERDWNGITYYLPQLELRSGKNQTHRYRESHVKWAQLLLTRLNPRPKLVLDSTTAEG